MAGWIQTYSGRAFDPLRPDPEQLVIEDVAHALSLVNRYTGHTFTALSVGRHSLAVMKLLELRGFNRITQLYGLLHDATEAYLSDIAAPVKQSPIFDGYREAEKKLEALIMQRFIPELDMLSDFARGRFREVTKAADWDMLLAERNAVLPPGAWEPTKPPADAVQAFDWAAEFAWSPLDVERAFLKYFDELGGRP